MHKYFGVIFLDFFFEMNNAVIKLEEMIKLLLRE